MTTSTDPFRVLCVVGARPNFMKVAPIMRAFETEPALQGILLHTGQHYDEAMKASFFEQLSIAEPDVDLGVGSASHAVQTAEVMRRFEPELDRLRPGAVLVVGDVNSTIACALLAVKKGVPAIHVKATSRQDYAAGTAPCPRRSTGSSPTRSRTCSSPPSGTPPATWSGRESTRRGSSSSATS